MDYAFKLMLGSPEHTGITIHFLNSILADQPRITHVEILNPFLCKQSEDVEQDLRHEVAPSVEVVERAVPVESDGNLLCVGHLWGRGDMAPW